MKRMLAFHDAPVASGDAGWDLDITPSPASAKLRWSELFQYRDLWLLLVRRDFVTSYKQTILGPAWFLLQPLLRIAIFYIIFARIAGVSTDSIPPLLFYLTGLVFWEFFASSLRRIGDTFLENQHIFGKVYFPRLIMPLSVLSSGSMKMGLQALLLLAFWIYYAAAGAPIAVNYALILLPVYVSIIAAMAMGAGLIFAALTAKYRDLKFLLDTAVQLLLYLTPVLYPLSLATGKYKLLLLANPLTGVMEAIKYSLLGTGTFQWAYLAYGATISLLVLLAGIWAFGKAERNFIDTV